MNCARNCENLLNFVKVNSKILLVPFFPDTLYMSPMGNLYKLDGCPDEQSRQDYVCQCCVG